MSKRVAPQVKSWVSIANGTTTEANISRFVPKLLAAFQNDFTVGEACEYAGLPRRTFYNHLKNDPAFAEEIRKAKNFPKIVAKKRVMNIINNGTDREAGPMARWLLEKREPEIYGKTAVVQQNNQQNNYFSLSNEQIDELCKSPMIMNTDPSELLETLETMEHTNINAG